MIAARRHSHPSSSHSRVWTLAWPLSLTLHLLAFIVLYFVFVRAGDSLAQAAIIRRMQFIEPSSPLEDRPQVRAQSAPALSSLLELPTARSLAIPPVGPGLSEGPSVIGLDSGRNPGAAPAIFSTSPRQSPPEVSFFGSSATGYRIVFVVDHSGSMWDQFSLVCDELLASLARLEPSQQFQLIFFSSGPPIQMKPKVFLDASPANKQAAYDFLQAITGLDPASGSTDPTPALRLALTMPSGPADVIFLLSDGDFPQTVPAMVNRTNPQARTQVNTIGFGYKGGSELLRALAGANRGSFRFVQTSRSPSPDKSPLDTLLP